jgi:cold shock CspA family protein
VIVLNLNKKIPTSTERIEKQFEVIADRVVCTVKWFRQEDGYGFILSETINSDIFIHCSKIDLFKTGSFLLPNDILNCKIILGIRGPQVEEIYEYNLLPRENNLKSCEGFVKWFNVKADFGFIKPVSTNNNNTNVDKDIFISGKKMRHMGIDCKELRTNRRVSCIVRTDSSENQIAEKITFLD